jgi:dephospho-CoA kinase
MKKVGLTGGIATGKTTVMWMFQEMGSTIINADEISHKLLEPDTVVWKLLFERYGAHIMQKGHIIDRPALARIIFADEEERKYVEKTIHPRVHEEIDHLIATTAKDGKHYAIIEVLFEVRWDKDCDAIIVVRCDSEQQIIRCMEKFNLTREEALNRIKIQRPLGAKIAKATFVIDNAGSKTETLVQAQRLFRMFEKGEFSSK